jgi:hypothetical protein
MTSTKYIGYLETDIPDTTKTSRLCRAGAF